jgi:hypothetical protein
MAFPLEKFLSTFHLGIFWVSDFEPGGSFPFRCVGSKAVLGYDTL